MSLVSRLLCALIALTIVLPSAVSADERTSESKPHNKLRAKTAKPSARNSNNESTAAQDTPKTKNKMNEVLKEGETGPFGELSRRKLPNGCVFIFVPSLIAMLTRAEQLKENPLTETEVIRIRDQAPVIVSKASMVKTLEASRGYKDVDTTDTWKTWLKLRQE